MQGKEQERRSVLSELRNKQKKCSRFEKKPGHTRKKTEIVDCFDNVVAIFVVRFDTSSHI